MNNLTNCEECNATSKELHYYSVFLVDEVKLNGDVCYEENSMPVQMCETCVDDLMHSLSFKINSNDQWITIEKNKNFIDQSSLDYMKERDRTMRYNYKMLSDMVAPNFSLKIVGGSDA